MFENTTLNSSNENLAGNPASSPTLPGGPRKPVEDIFSQVDTGQPERPTVLGPKTKGNESGVEGNDPMEAFRKSMDTKKIILAGLGLGGLVLIFIGVWYSYYIFLPSRQSPEVKNQPNATNQPTVQTPDNNSAPTNVGDANNLNNPASQSAQEVNIGNNNLNAADSGAPVSPDALFGTDVLTNLSDSSGNQTGSSTPSADSGADTDNDSLSDSEEENLGTDPGKMDTDGDGLFDGEEVNIYRTDPLNPDTDGDSFPDGMEVKGGYDPKGTGKLFETPAN